MDSKRDFGRLLVIALAAALQLLLLTLPAAFVNSDYVDRANGKLAAFLIAVTLWTFIESLASGNRLSLPIKADGPRWLPLAIGLALLTTFWVSLIDAALSRPTEFGGVAVFGTALMAAGVAVRCFSIRALGGFFVNEVAVLPGQTLMTNGIYGWIRHPSETGTLAVAFGSSLLLGSEYGLSAGVLVLLPLVMWRTRLEDRMLGNHYPFEFPRYAASVPAFLPGIRRLSPLPGPVGEMKSTRSMPLLSRAKDM